MAVAVKSVSDDEVLLKKSAWGSWIFGAIMLTIGLFVVLGMAKKSTLLCERPSLTEEPTCVLVREKIIDLNPERVEAGELKSTHIRTSRGSKGRTFYSVYIDTDVGTLKLGVTSSSDREEVEGRARRIELFRRDRWESELKMVDRSYLGPLLFGGFAGLVGFVHLFLVSFGTIRLSVREDVIEYQTRTLLGSGRELPLQLSDFQSATVERSTGQYGRPIYRVALVDHGGQNRPLTDDYTGRAGPKERAAQAIRMLIARQVAERRREERGERPDQILERAPLASSEGWDFKVDGPAW